ncbi:MAG: hypothetical protein HC918_08195 [Oscillatoriales cyanobacterium SM2_1_8]|nr:hypothetical protein [Oscillatoriales cyanobacterium SM2_1_8]
MTYRDKLHPWCVVWDAPDRCSVAVGRYRRRQDAEARLQTLGRQKPESSYRLCFDAHGTYPASPPH